MKRILKRSGSALVWAVCAMMVLTLIAASLLTLAAAYYEKTTDEVMQTKALLMAQSGANYAVHMLDIDGGDYSEDWLEVEEDESIPSKRVYLSGGTSKNDEYVTLYFSMEKKHSGKKPENDGEEELPVYVLRVRSEAFCGDASAECTALFWGYGGDGLWNFTGFIQE